MFRRFRRACGRLRFRCPAACRRFRGMGCMFCAMGCMFRRPEPGFRVPGRAGVRGACFFLSVVRCLSAVCVSMEKYFEKKREKVWSVW
jgi:hypothetical protein